MATTYQNPVYPQAFADPFVLKHCGTYWAYCTGLWEDGRCFGIARSSDLVSWSAVGGALEPLPDGWSCYWAPEVSYYAGRFWMYYSVGDEQRMHIRVAVADAPAGPFIDSGRRLTGETFAIDPHVFTDDDGARHLFYATDFLDHSHIGTGTVRDRLLDPWTPAGRPQPVARALHDWQVYDPQRAEKGGVRWHTVEGSFVLKRKGRYYHMFSGGNWQNPSYGVSYALTDDIAAPGEWAQAADGARVLPILRSLPGRVIGPGHNSVVRGPDNRQLYCVYHRWLADLSARAMAIDPLDWAGERMLVLGPSSTPQPAPPAPTLADSFAQPQPGALGELWECRGGHWLAGAGVASQRAEAGVAEAACRAVAPCFLAELSLRAPGDAGACGVALLRDGASGATVLLEPGRRRLLLRDRAAGGLAWQRELALPEDFAPAAFHLLRVEADGALLQLTLDQGPVRWAGRLTAPVDGIALRTEGAAADFAGFALTIGWEECFDGAAPPAARGWAADDAAGWSVRDRQLCYDGAAPSLIGRGPALTDYQLVVNARWSGAPADAGYGFLPAARPGEPGPLLRLARDAGGWALLCEGARVGLPADFNPAEYQQFRFDKRGQQLDLSWEGQPLGTLAAPAGPTTVQLYAHTAGAQFELVRVTAR